jgi:hypothetical protein
MGAESEASRSAGVDMSESLSFPPGGRSKEICAMASEGMAADGGLGADSKHDITGSLLERFFA